MKTYIISTSNPTAGLCNRIKCLVTCLRLSDLNPSTVVLKWHKNDRFNCEFEDLFDNKFASYSSINGLHQEDIKKKYVNTWRLLFSLDQLYKPETGKEHIYQSIDEKYQAIALNNRNEFLPYFNILEPTQTIQKEVDSFAKKFDENTISMALRTWHCTESRQHLFKLERVLSILESNPNSTFFISCDSEAVLNQLKISYGKRIFNYPSRTEAGDRNSKQGIQDALIDLLLLSKNKKLKASFMSTFSEVAWWLGQCEADVEII